MAIGRFSGSERRLVEVYLIIKSASLFALLDEPFTHISPIQVEQVKQLLIEEKANKGIVITDHMYQHVLDLYDKLYVLTPEKMYLTKQAKDIETLGYARL